MTSETTFSGGIDNLTAVVSFSIDYKSLEKIHIIMIERGMSRSAAIRYLLKMGMIYVFDVLRDQLEEKTHDSNTEKAEST